MTRKNVSIWQEERGVPSIYPPQMAPKYEVIIVGGGMTGMLLAYTLLDAGVKSLAVMEADTIGSGTSGRSTAKVTAQHNLIYDKLLTGLGYQQASQYARANMQAIGAYEKLIQANSIECGFVRRGAYLYTRNPKELKAIKAEVRAATALGLNARFEDKLSLPIQTAGAVCFPDQAQFDPIRFLHALTRLVAEKGGHIFQHTPVLSVRGDRVTLAGGMVRGKHIALCTHYPLLNKSGLYILRLYQSRSYVLALQNAVDPIGMYLDIRKGGLSFRTMESDVHGPLLLLGGAGHTTGHDGECSHYARLEALAKNIYPQSRVVARWSAQDCMTHDAIPYIGRQGDEDSHLYLATGFNKWGMTSAMVSARLITDLIIKGKSPMQEVFSPRRLNLSLSAESFLLKSADTAADIAVGLFAPKRKEGVCLRCTHMGGALHYNNDEGSWDCPSHGSRFNAEGQVIENPAVNPLKGGNR